MSAQLLRLKRGRKREGKWKEGGLFFVIVDVVFVLIFDCVSSLELP